MSELSYSMLNPYEIGILSRRPLLKDHVKRLWKSTLSKFLIRNGYQCHWSDDKNKLVEMIFQIEEDEICHREHTAHRGHSHVPNGFQPNFVPQVSGTFGGNQTNYYVVHNSPNFYSHQSDVPSDEDLFHTTQVPCSCHECLHEAPPVPEYVEPVRPNEVTGSELVLESDSALFFEPCNALLHLDDSEDEDFPSLECTCTVSAEQLLQNVSLGSDPRQVFLSLMNGSIGEIVSFLQCFGVQVDGSGCRIHLLLLLRDLLEEQSNAIRSVPDQNGAASLQSTPGGSRAGFPTSATEMDQLSENFVEMMAQEEKKSSSGPNDHDPNQCCICLQSPREIAFVPCGHTLCCQDCSRKVKECPVCRKKIFRRLKIFFS